MSAVNTWSIFGHQRQIDTLQQFVRSQKLASSYIFYGPSGVGKKQVLSGVLRQLFCQNNGCSECEVCRSITADQYQEIFQIKLKPGDGSISVETVRQGIEHLQLRALDNRYRVLTISQAERLTSEAANSLLKILEEPPKDCYIFLLTEQLSLLPPTIRSRCQLMKFLPLAASQMTAWLENEQIDPRLHHLLQTVALGRPGQVRQLLADNLASFNQLTERSLVLVSGNLSKAMTAISMWFQEIKKSEEETSVYDLSERQIENLQLILRDIIFSRLLTKPSVISASVAHLVAHWPAARILTAMKGLETLRLHLRQNANAQLAWEHYLTNSIYHV